MEDKAVKWDKELRVMLSESGRSIDDKSKICIIADKIYVNGKEDKTVQINGITVITNNSKTMCRMEENFKATLIDDETRKEYESHIILMREVTTDRNAFNVVRD